MRVRTLQLRLLGAAIAVLWAVAAVLVIVGYRPGGPFDLVVGLAASTPLLVALLAVAWPPAVRGHSAFAAIVWLGLAAILVLIPSIADILGRLTEGGTQTLMPSAVAIYPWIVALAATAGLAGIGIARRTQGPAASRARRAAVASAVAVALVAASGLAFGAAAVGNEIALAGRPVAGSPYGPTGSDDPPLCDGDYGAGPQARLALRVDAEADGRSTGTVDLAGSRSGMDLRWGASVVGDRDVGTYGAARIGGSAWTREPRGRWTPALPAALDDATVDANAVAVALPREMRTLAEEVGIEVVEGALARHCRVAVDGTTLLAAFPQARWLVPDGTPVERWRGTVDYWVFADGQVGVVEAFANGTAGPMRPGALLGTVRLRMTATDRDVPVTLSPPS